MIARKPVSYQIAYPSGRRFQLRGRLFIYQGSGKLMAPAIECEAGRIIILDPRAIIEDDRSEVVFTGCTTAELVADTPI